MPIQNTCLPTSIYSPAEHTLFLGCSIKSFEVTAGWGQDASQLTVSLTKDECAGSTKVYYDYQLNRQTTTDVDPGFLGLNNYIIGCPVYFRVKDFEFCGIVQSWEEIKSINDGNPVYRVNIVSPTQLLEGAKLIIGEYSGSIGTAHNIFNVYGFLEQFSGIPCPQVYLNNLATGEGPQFTGYVPGDAGVDGAIFGTDAGGYGGAKLNYVGMQWNRVKTAVNILMCSFPPVSNGYSPYGRLLFYGTESSGYGLCSYDRTEALGPFDGHSGYLSEYILDLSELPDPTDYFRLNGSNISVLDAINQVCDICSYDYYIELTFVKTANTNIAPSGVAKIIKVKAVSRATQSVGGTIQNYIDTTNTVISSSVGKELRAENTTSFLIGGNKQTIYQVEASDDPEGDGDLTDPTGYPAEADDVILPYFGKDIDEDVIIPRKEILNGKSKWYFYAPLDNINNQLQYIKPLVAPSGYGDQDKDYDSIKITENELRAALEGYDQWISYTMMNNLVYDVATTGFIASGYITALGQAIVDTNKFNYSLSGPYGGNALINVMNRAQNNENVEPKDLNNGRSHAEILESLSDTTQKQRYDDLHAIHDWVNSYASNYYGKYFQVRVPYTCVRTDDTSNAVLFSEECSDGGWTDQSGVIKLTNGGTGITDNDIERFKTSDGRIGCFVRYDYNFSNLTRQGLTALDENDYILYSGIDEYDEYKLWLRAEAEKDFVYLSYNKRGEVSGKASYYGPRAVVKVQQPIINDTSGDLQNINFLLELMNIAAKDVDAGYKTEVINRIAGGIRESGFQRIWSAIAFRGDYVMPDAAAVPIKSNTTTYGPWVSLGPAGSVRVDQDPGLVPWEYNGMDDLNTAANALVTNGLSLAQIEEMGELTIPGYPEIPLLAELGAVSGGYYGSSGHLVENRDIGSGVFTENDYNGTPVTFNYAYLPSTGWEGIYGPHITNTTVQVALEGVQTRYQFRTFTKKFGNMQKMNAERIKQIGKNKLEMKRESLKREEEKRKRLEWYGPSVGVDRVSKDRKGSQLAHNTPHDIIIGKLTSWHDYDGTGTSGEAKRTLICTEDLLDLQSELASNQQNKAMMSWDGLIRPISLWNTSYGGNLPGYPTTILSAQKYNLGYGTQPPIYSSGGSSEYSPNMEYKYLNPFANPTGIPGDTSYASALSERCDYYNGHDFEILGRGLSGESGHISSPIEQSGGDYYPDYRMFALRGPLVINGWGYDLDGFPIPNKADTYNKAKSGDYVATGLHMKFLDNWLKKPETWITAPVDLRYDRQRGVWTIPQYRLIECSISGIDYPTSTAYSGIVDDYFQPDLWSTSGTQLSNARIAAYNFIDDGTVSPSGSKFIAYYEPSIQKYWMLDRRKCYFWGNLNDPLNATGYQDKIYGGSGIVLRQKGTGESPYSLQIDNYIGITNSNTCYLTGTPIDNAWTGPGGSYEFDRCNSFSLGRGLKAVPLSGIGYTNGTIMGLDSRFTIVGTSGVGLLQYGTSGEANSISCQFPIVANHSDCGNAGISFSGHMHKVVANSIDMITSMSVDLSGTPCPTGCGYSSVTVSITYGKTRLNFNEFGLFIGSTGLGNTVIGDTI